MLGVLYAQYSLCLNGQGEQEWKEDRTTIILQDKEDKARLFLPPFFWVLTDLRA